MNDEPQYSRGVVVTAAAWLATGMLLLVAWLAWAMGPVENVHFAVLVAETACVVSAVAAVAHLRCYAARICRLIRVTSALERPHDAEVREFPPRR